MTRELVKYYVCYRLGRAGYEDFSSSGQQQIITTTDSSSIQNSISVKRTLKLMGDEFSNAYFGAFDDMTNTINVHGEDLKEVLYKIYDVTCGTGIEWGRLVGLFVFSSLLAIKAMACHRPDVVENIIQWTADYLEQERFSEWINQHGGWVSSYCPLIIIITPGEKVRREWEEQRKSGRKIQDDTLLITMIVVNTSLLVAGRNERMRVNKVTSG